MARKPVAPKGKSKRTPRRPASASVKAAADRAEARAKGKPLPEPDRPDQIPYSETFRKASMEPVIVIAEPAPSKPEAPSRLGRPSEYNPDMCPTARDLCERGATDDELADHFNVSARTIYRWKLTYPDFCHSIQSGKDLADERVERSLYQMATGRYVIEQQAMKIKTGQYEEDVKVVEVEKFLEPEVPAAIFWLKNRRSGKWKDRSVTEHTGKDGGAIEMKVDTDLNQARRVAWALSQAMIRQQQLKVIDGEAG